MAITRVVVLSGESEDSDEVQGRVTAFSGEVNGISELWARTADDLQLRGVLVLSNAKEQKSALRLDVYKGKKIREEGDSIISKYTGGDSMSRPPPPPQARELAKIASSVPAACICGFSFIARGQRGKWCCL